MTQFKVGDPVWVPCVVQDACVHPLDEGKYLVVPGDIHDAAGNAWAVDWRDMTLRTNDSPPRPFVLDKVVVVTERSSAHFPGESQHRMNVRSVVLVTVGGTIELPAWAVDALRRELEQ